MGEVVCQENCLFFKKGQNMKPGKSTSTRMDIKNLSKEQLGAWLEENGIKAYRAGQIFKWVFSHQLDQFNSMTDLGQELREILAVHFVISRLQTERIETSRDGTQKFLFRLDDANHIETVLIPEKNHHTLCISSQVGCAMGCRFCLTAKDGFVRNLTAGEIVAQVRDIKKHIGNRPLSNIVLMGMGEPLANYANVVQAIRILTDRDFGLEFSTRRVTLSTAGLVPELLQLGKDAAVNLAVSLNATDNETRSRLMPVNNKYPLENLLEACRMYPLAPRKRITFEYILIQGINDSMEDARRLSKLLRPIKAKINLIPFNEHPGSLFRRPDEKTILAFQDILVQHHYTAMVRSSKGQDISAACGQLRASHEIA
jgi:23S rRNA (adenine2503-C2)-methyltransferase